DERGGVHLRTLGGAPDIGATEAPSVIPAAVPVTVANTKATGANTQLVVITYVDDAGIDVGTLSNGDITVTGPGGPIPAAFVSVDDNTNGTPRTATYQFTPPGGYWNGDDNGSYSVGLNANAVFDADAPSAHA